MVKLWRAVKTNISPRNGVEHTTERELITLTDADLDEVAGGAIYLEIDGITGSVTTQGFANQPELNSFQWGVSNQK